MAFALPRDHFEEKLKDSGMSLQDADKFGLHLLDCVEASKALDQAPPHGAIAAFRIPYFDLEGNPIKFERIRWLGDVKVGKYRQKKGSDLRAYLTPEGWQGRTWHEILDTKEPICVVEGELKAMALHSLKGGPPTIGLTGVDAWRSRKRGKILLPEIQSFCSIDREIYILFDHDGNPPGEPNPEVRRAEIDLYSVLLSKSATPYICRIGRPGDAYKVAPDDLVREGDVARLMECVEQSKIKTPVEMSPVMLLLNRIYEFKGSFWDADERAVYSRPHMKTHLAPISVTVRDGDRVKHKPAFELYEKSPYRQSITMTGLVDSDHNIVEEEGHVIGNMYRGLSTQATPGDSSQFDEYIAGLCSKEPEIEYWLWQWLGHLIQRPTVRMSTSIILQGAQGVGKSMLGQIICEVLGTGYGDQPGLATNLGPDAFAGGFNGHMEGRTFILIDELSRSSRRAEDQFKHYRTADTHDINRKYGAQSITRNNCNFMITTNRAFALRMSEDSRRDFVLEVPRFWDHDEFASFVRWWKSNLGVVRWRLEQVKLMGGDHPAFDPHAPAPATRARSEMAYHALGDAELVMEDIADFYRGFVVQSGELSAFLKAHVDMTGVDVKIGPRSITQRLKEMGAEQHTLTVKGKLVRIMLLPEPLWPDHIDEEERQTWRDARRSVLRSGITPHHHLQTIQNQLEAFRSRLKHGGNQKV